MFIECVQVAYADTRIHTYICTRLCQYFSENLFRYLRANTNVKIYICGICLLNKMEQSHHPPAVVYCTVFNCDKI